MIEFTEQSQTKLKLASCSITTIVDYLVVSLISVLWLSFWLYFTPAYSSLACYKTTFNRIDCQIEEKALLSPHLTQTNIKNVKKVVGSYFGSRDVRIHLKANPNLLYFGINWYQKTYHYPTNPFSVILLRNLNPFNWFGNSNQLKQISDFVNGETKQSILFLEQRFTILDLPILALFYGIPTCIVFLVIFWCLTVRIDSIYEFDLGDRSLIINFKGALSKDISRKYSFDKINQVKLDTDYKTNFNRGRIIIEFASGDEYPIDEFSNLQTGINNFSIITNFLGDSLKQSNSSE